MYNVAKIFDLLKERNLEQKDLAKGIGISDGNFSQWKRGLTKPSDKVMQKIADYFNLPLSEFYIYDTEDSTVSDANIDYKKRYEILKAAMNEMIDAIEKAQLNSIKILRGISIEEEDGNKPANEETVRVYRAAKSDNNAEHQILEVPKSEMDELRKAPKVTKIEDL